MLRYLIWDWNGTLLDDLWLALDVANGMLRRRGLPEMDTARYREIFDFPVIEYYRRAGFDLASEPFPRVAEEFIAEYNRRVPECSLHQGVAELLEHIAAAGMGQAVLTAGRQESVAAAVSHYRVAHHFDALHGLTDHLAVSKVETGRQLVDTLTAPKPVGNGLTLEEIVLVGDTTHDWEVARELGLACLLVAAGHHPIERLSQTGAPVFPSLEDATPAILGRSILSD